MTFMLQTSEICKHSLNCRYIWFVYAFKYIHIHNNVCKCKKKYYITQWSKQSAKYLTLSMKRWQQCFFGICFSFASVQRLLIMYFKLNNKCVCYVMYLTVYMFCFVCISFVWLVFVCVCVLTVFCPFYVQ